MCGPTSQSPPHDLQQSKAQHSAITHRTHFTTRPTTQYTPHSHTLWQATTTKFTLFCTRITIRMPQTPWTEHSKHGKMQHSIGKTFELPWHSCRHSWLFHTITNKPLTQYSQLHIILRKHLRGKKTQLSWLSKHAVCIHYGPQWSTQSLCISPFSF